MHGRARVRSSIVVVVLSARAYLIWHDWHYEMRQTQELE